MYGNAINILLKVPGKFHPKGFIIPHSDCMVLPWQWVASYSRYPGLLYRQCGRDIKRLKIHSSSEVCFPFSSLGRRKEGGHQSVQQEDLHLGWDTMIWCSIHYPTLWDFLGKWFFLFLCRSVHLTQGAVVPKIKQHCFHKNRLNHQKI